MNKLIVSFILMSTVFSYSLKAQCDVRMYDIYTPNGSPVVTFLMCESSLQTRQGFDAYYTQTYPNAEKIITYDNLSSTRKFNCHGYAWLRVEQGIDRWIGTGWNNDIDDPEQIYMTDGSYQQVSQATYPGKVSWASGDHSAVTTSQQGVFISKWNEYPLMRHAWNYSPYGTNNLKYYVKAPPSISGPDYVCTSGSTFTINNLPAGVSVFWQTSSSMYVVSSSGNSALISKVSSSATDLGGWVKATIQTGGTPVILQKNNVIAWRSGMQNTSVGESIMQGCNNSPYGCEFFLYVQGSALAGSNFTWSIDNGWQPDPQGYFFSNITGDYFCGSFYVTVNFTDVCGMQSTIFKNFTVDCSAFISYPNPTSNILTVEKKSANTTNTANMNTTKNVSSFNIRLYDIQGNLMKTFSFTGEKYEIDLSSLRNGTYSMHISDTKNANTEIHKIIVKH